MDGSPGKLNRILRNIFKIMAKHPEIVCILFALSFSFLSKYTRSLGNLTPHTVGQPPPQRFFSPGSPVLDYYHGNIGDVGRRLGDVDRMYVMYYAPWCAKSMEVRAEFEKAARYLKGEVDFVAVNCWYTKGSCRQQNRFLSFPVLFFYHSQLDGYEFKGIPTAPYIIKFAEDLIRPMTYLTSYEELVMFMAHRDNAVIAYFDFNASPQPPGYLQYYYASMRIREYDLSDSIDFGLITDKNLAKKFEMKRSKTIFIIRALNETLKYPTGRNFTCSAIVEWINNFKQPPVVKWLLPSYVKSLTLSSEMDKGPALILFTRDAPLSTVHHQVAKLREIALSYRNCQNKTKIRNIVDTTTYLRWASILHQLDVMQECQSLAKQATNSSTRGSSTTGSTGSGALPPCCVSVVTGETPGRNFCDVCVNYAPSELPLRPCDAHALSQLSGLRMLHAHAQKSSSAGCSVITPNYDPTQHISYCCDRGHQGSARGHGVRFAGFDTRRRGYQIHPDRSVDPHVTGSRGAGAARRCARLRLERGYGWGEGLDVRGESFGGGDPPGESLTGRECATNSSLRFYAMDAKLNRDFARNLGIRLRDYNNSNALVLLDTFNELQFVMNDQVTTESIVEFIENYTLSLQPRTLRSQAVSQSVRCSGASEDVCIHELSSHTFTDLVMQEDKDVVVLYYAPWCGFCKNLAHVYLSLAKYFRSSPGIIFARINADVNDLVWEYTPASYPQITIFPAYRKQESVTFPDHVTRSVPTLVQFILHHAAQSVRLESGLSSCSRSCIHANVITSGERVRKLSRDIHEVAARINRVAERGAECARLVEELRSLPAGDAGTRRTIAMYKRREVTYRDYVTLLQARLTRMLQQEKNARELNRALRSTSGSHIEKHKLISIIKRYEVFKSQHVLEEEVTEHAHGTPGVTEYAQERGEEDTPHHHTEL